MKCAISVLLTETATVCLRHRGRGRYLGPDMERYTVMKKGRDNYRPTWGELQEETSARVMEQVGNIIPFL